MAPRSTAYSSGTSSPRRRAPQLSPGIRGPQEGPSAINPRHPGHQEHPGGRPISRLRPRRAAAAPQLPGRAPHLPWERRNPALTGAAAPGTPEGSSAIRGKPPGLPQTGHKSIFGLRRQIAERNVLALCHLDHALTYTFNISDM
ncbi:hypothetical protein NDU88_002638 [Pleurodeles waltl]|uniref:Uncharacterized protein n=1 Tax=Pleurodeles waltl TaxID=8319 RepID=A0AAV7NHP4_PLEWA|nr:hypothetical protein NDU88_002638 [Pleurodeles waltl]